MYFHTVDGSQITQIQCFRSDIPNYIVQGGINSELAVSSGEIVLWVMDSLEVTEHFTEKDGTIQKEGFFRILSDEGMKQSPHYTS